MQAEKKLKALQNLDKKIEETMNEEPKSQEDSFFRLRRLNFLNKLRENYYPENNAELIQMEALAL
ncbi:MAG TPA: hypothetical protein VHO03_16485 [Ignavibacteriales bacterium]|nr:hypothetical protein [Ignavibacteriales bacterium]